MGSRKIVSLLLYVCIMVVYIYTLKGFKGNNDALRNKIPDFPKEFIVMGKYEKFFFTMWTFILQIVFVNIAIIDEFSNLVGFPANIKKFLGKTRAFIFNALLFPCTLLVIILFWSLWHIDRELIFPKAVDAYFPSWLNHMLHTFIGIPILLEVLLPKKDHFINFKTAAPALLLFCAVYQALYFYIYFRDGVWLYPVYKVLDWPQRFVFNVIQVALILSFQYVGLTIQNSKKPKAQKKTK